MLPTYFADKTIQRVSDTDMRLLSPTRRFIFLQKGHDTTSIAVAEKSEGILTVLTTNSANRRLDIVSGTEVPVRAAVELQL